MFKKLILASCLFTLFQACTNEPAGQAADASPAATTPATGADGLKDQAVDETDYVGRVRATLRKVQNEYDLTAGKMPGQGKITTSIDDNFNFTIQNEVGNDLFKTQVNLKNLNPDDGGMMLLPDTKPGEYPGLRIMVKDGAPGVSIFKNGQLQKEERHLDFYMPQRNNIENIAPALSSILNVVHGKVQ